MLFREVLWALALTRASTAHVIRRQEDTSVVPSALPSETALESAFPSSVASESSAPAPTSTGGVIGKGCAGVASLVAEAKASDPDATVVVPPSLALSCLESVPVDVERDIGVIEFFLPYLSFQSTLGYLKKPPQSYLLPGVDVIGGFAAIREKLRKAGYKNQFEWALDIKRVLSAAADGHLGYSPAILGVFDFQRTLNITSASVDGVELPKIYDVDDIVRLGIDSASEIVSIDNTPVQDFIGRAAAEETFQDPDAQFNSLFWSIPIGWSGNTRSAFIGASTLPDSHTVRFANGTTKEYPNYAGLNVPFDNITSGDDLHKVVEIPPPPGEGPAVTPTRLVRHRIVPIGQTETETETETETAAEETPSAAPSATAVPGYPEPVVIHQSGYVAGYFLNGSSAHDDTCVLVLTSFQSENQSVYSGNGEYEETRRVFRDFFRACADAGRTKLILDVSANGGGFVFQGYELYKNLFPDNKAWSGSRLRAHAALDIMGQNSYSQEGGESLLLTGLFLNPATGKKYAEWKDIYGPTVFPEDRETNTMTYDFANKSLLFDPATDSPFSITGFDPDNPAPKQPFAKEDIIVLTDGYCASTCTVVVGLLQREAGVRTIAVGGRPLVAPMQAVGGVKGSQVVKIAGIQEQWGQIIINQSVTPPKNLLSALPSNSTPPLMPIDLTQAQVNFRNAYPEDNQNGPPAQFLYEAANCRRFYRPEYLTDIQAEWRDVADVAWHGAQCAPGSTVNADGKIDSKAPAYTDAVRSKQSVYDGPGSLTNAEWLALATNLTGSTEGIASGAGRRGVELSVGVVAAVLVSAVLML
ncbi:hypothetical protein B0T25DRAFT_139219 [Lasiosphaeria hispida]|uniref:Tail specific protease domain-containing protein n=1 Tax=Lasiosphaeria hispida TaxID=260671 RepID=A0AAJ0HKW7_9PEZI|nr:hypothetical protein B0T25DRAFT_139219 [Lasiosphaeria hispida]